MTKVASWFSGVWCRGPGVRLGPEKRMGPGGERNRASVHSRGAKTAGSYPAGHPATLKPNLSANRWFQNSTSLTRFDNRGTPARVDSCASAAVTTAISKGAEKLGLGNFANAESRTYRLVLLILGVFQQPCQRCRVCPASSATRQA